MIVCKVLRNIFDPELFFFSQKKQRQMSPSFRNKKITKLHLVMLQGEDLKNKHARVMVLVHDTSSECDLQRYAISLKYL